MQLISELSLSLMIGLTGLGLMDGGAEAEAGLLSSRTPSTSQQQPVA